MALFDALAERYDRWFDTEDGRALFERELACISLLLPAGAGPSWIEIGAGTGRFGSELGVAFGVDVSLVALSYAKGRGMRAVCARGESLPVHDECASGILMVTALCFVHDPVAVVGEAARVLRPGRDLVVGIVRRDSAWGEWYERLAKEGHAYYSHARFLTFDDLVHVAGRQGLAEKQAASCLFSGPGEPLDSRGVEPGNVPDSGFVAVSFKKAEIEGHYGGDIGAWS